MLLKDKVLNGYFNVSEFQITYMYRDNENSYLLNWVCFKTMWNKLCTENVVSTLTYRRKRCSSTLTTMNLTFGETEIMTKETVAKGFKMYFDRFQKVNILYLAQKTINSYQIYSDE